MSRIGVARGPRYFGGTGPSAAHRGMVDVRRDGFEGVVEGSGRLVREVVGDAEGVKEEGVENGAHTNVGVAMMEMMQ